MTVLGSVPRTAGFVPAVEPRARFSDLVVSEWIKAWSLRSTWWTLGVTLLVAWGSAFAAAKADYDNIPGYKDLAPHPAFAVSDSVPQAGWMTVMIAAAALGALAMANEYGTGLIRTTTIAVPSRGPLVLAKAVVQTVIWTVLGCVAASGGFVIAQSVLSGRHASVTLGEEHALRALVAAALVAPVCALIGLGVGTLVRHGAASVGLSAFGLLMLPAFFSQNKHWSADINHAFVLPAFQRLVQPWDDGDFRAGFLRATVPGSWTVYLLWPLVSLALAVWVVRKRDV
ncbi:ABC transporter permease [Streptacidiphilus rugosus]|uniref:ABC transporter permease n=1 Tax=Streptacidiphilus rugosus TaxID=405783 RepID=UPI00068BCD53|nr:ABC transporter permease [Streptacidiphilus rugosus]